MEGDGFGELIKVQKRPLLTLQNNNAQDNPKISRKLENH